MFGYYINRGLRDVKFMLPTPPELKEKAKSETDKLLDLIYCLDERTGLPCGAISQYLSDKTNEQVRSFIEQKLLYDIPSDDHAYPASLRDDMLKLDSEFIAKTSRNRFESRDDYERRVQSYFEEIENDKQKQKTIQMLRKKYAKKD